MAEAPSRPKRLWVGRYHLQTRLGSGGQGTVYRAHDVMLDRPVAVKFPKLSRLADPKAAERFRREAQALAKLRHPNILAVHELGEFKNQLFLVTDLLVGRTLAEAVRERQWSAEEAAGLVEKLARALHHIHQAGLIHRDIKPSNIFIEESGNPLIMDFGLAREMGGRTDATRTGDLLGTPGFVSPEQASGPGELDARTDVYSLGVIFYLLLARRLPFVGTPLQIIRQSAERDPKPPGRYRSGIPADIQAVCLQAIARDPAKRFAGAEAFAEALAARKASPAFHRAVRRSEWTAKAVDLIGTYWPYLATGAAVVVFAAWFAVWNSSRHPTNNGPIATPPGDGIVIKGPGRTDGGPPPDKAVPRKDAGIKTATPDGKKSDGPPELEKHKNLAAAQWEESVRVGAGTYQFRWRWCGPPAVFDRSSANDNLWAVGELQIVLRAGLAGAGLPVLEQFRLFWKRSGKDWYCDPLTYFAVLIHPIARELPADGAAALNHAVLGLVRRLNEGRTAWLHFEQDRRGDPSAIAARAWLWSPSLGGRSDAQPRWFVRLPDDFPAPFEPHPLPGMRLGGTADLEADLADLAAQVLERAEKQWQFDQKGRLQAIRIAAALAEAGGFGQTSAAKAGDCRRLLLKWIGRVVEDARRPASMEKLLEYGNPGRLLRLIRGEGDDPGWDEFAVRMRAVAERWRENGGAGPADGLLRWVNSAGP